jgi:Family of unknown function (DUF5906)
MADKDDNIIHLSAEFKRIKNQIEGNLDDIEPVGSIHKSRLMEEASNPLLARMNKNYAFIHSYFGKPMVLCKVYNEFHKKEINEFITPESLTIRHGNETAEGMSPDGKAKGMALGKWWLGHYHRKDYETVTYEPDRPPGEYSANGGRMYFNTWEGFAIEPAKGSWKRTKRHIWKILCNKDKNKFRYFIRWLAWSVQNPGTRAEVAVIFKGKKGAGKGFIFTQMVHIFGRHGVSIANREHLTGKHNAHLYGTSFLFADEAYYPGDKEVEGVLKNIITEPGLALEPKFKDLKINRNCLHIGMSTNSDWVIPASEDERRYFINKVEETYAKGQASDDIREGYFSKLWGEMDNGGREALLYDLLQINLKGWHPRNNIPETEELKEQIELSLPYIKRAMLYMLEDGTFPGTINGDGELVITTTNLLKYFHAIDHRYKVITDKAVVKLCEELLLARNRNNSIGRYFIFPELGILRKRWDKFMIRKMHWDLTERWIIQTKEYNI